MFLCSGFCVLTTTQSMAGKGLAGKMYLSPPPPPPPVAKAAFYSKVVIILLIIHCLLLFPLCVGFCVGSSFVVSFLITKATIGFKFYLSRNSAFWTQKYNGTFVHPYAHMSSAFNVKGCFILRRPQYCRYQIHSDAMKISIFPTAISHVEWSYFDYGNNFRVAMQTMRS